MVFFHCSLGVQIQITVSPSLSPSAPIPLPGCSNCGLWEHARSGLVSFTGGHLLSERNRGALVPSMTFWEPVEWKVGDFYRKWATQTTKSCSDLPPSDFCWLDFDPSTRRWLATWPPQAASLESHRGIHWSSQGLPATVHPTIASCYEKCQRLSHCWLGCTHWTLSPRAPGCSTAGPAFEKSEKRSLHKKHQPLLTYIYIYNIYIYTYIYYTYIHIIYIY